VTRIASSTCPKNIAEASPPLNPMPGLGSYTCGPDHPNVKQKPWAPASWNTISNNRSSIGPG
jgi:hypothetical protein